MRIKHILAFLGAAAASTAVLAAPVSVSADGSTVTVHGDTSQVIRLSPGQAQDTNGLFRLEDGREMKLTNRYSKVFMEVDGKREELLPLSRTTFVAARSGAQVAIDDEAFPGKVTLTEFRSK